MKNQTTTSTSATSWLTTRFSLASGLLIFLLWLFAVIQNGQAGNATWNLAPANGDWNTAMNWIPGIVPDGPSDTATFNQSHITSVSVPARTQVNGIVFNDGANGFTITANPAFALDLSGAGVTNNSGLTQNFVTAVHDSGNFGSIFFRNGSSAGTLTTFTNSGATRRRSFGGQTQFFDSSTGEMGIFVNQGGAATSAGFGTTVFGDTSTAGHATVINEGGTAGYTQGGGTFFINKSTAGFGTFTNDGPAVKNAANGFTSFNNASSAGSGTFINDGNAFANGFSGGVTLFHNVATADHGTFITNGGAVRNAFGGEVNLIGSSTAGFASFTTNGGSAIGALRGAVTFDGFATADHATFINNGGTISGVAGGNTQFFGNSTAAHGTFTTYGGTVNGAIGGFTFFLGTANAGDGVLTTEGGAVPGAIRGHTDFRGRASAANATLIANGGPGTDPFVGGVIRFYGNSDGGTARAVLSGNGNLDISVHFPSPMTIGSIEGDGAVFLGANNLTVGSNDSTTLFSGVIQDGGDVADTGGSLTKIGAGTLTLNGANTYTGSTTLEAGQLTVDNKSGSGTGFGPVQINAGKLTGRGTIAGSVTIGTGSGSGALIAPGKISEKPSIFIILSSLTFNADGSYHCDLNSDIASSDEIFASGITVNSGAQFLFADAGNTQLTPGIVFTVINNTAVTSITGTFANLPDGAIFAAGNNKFRVSYEGNDGNDFTLTVVP